VTAYVPHGFAVQSFAAGLASAAGKDQKAFLLDLIGPPRILRAAEGEGGRPASSSRSTPHSSISVPTSRSGASPHTIRSPMDDRPRRRRRLRQGRQKPARQADHDRPLHNQRDPARRRVRVHVRLRRPLPRQRPRTRRPAAHATRPTAASSAPSQAGDTSSTPPTNFPIASTRPNPSSTPSPIATTTTDPTRPLATKLQQGISEASAQSPVCAEPAHIFDILSPPA
jgi:hypothetical protein